MAKVPPGPPVAPPVQRLRLRYAKRGRLRFTSHRDIARAVERALRRAEVPMAYSAGFSPHPKVSWVGAAPTGVASEAEYVELGLAVVTDPEVVRAALDRSLSPGLDVLDAVVAVPGTSLPDRMEASAWSIALPGVPEQEAAASVAAFLAADEVLVERRVKEGRRTFDARAAVVSLAVVPDAEPGCATLAAVVRHVTPAVRPDDVLSGLRVVAGLVPPLAPRATRLAQGPLRATGEVDDPLAPDRDVQSHGATRPVDDREQDDDGA